jgi:hypothetical protein
MSQLYSVTINRKKVITRYLDPKGRKTETYEELIQETYRDLPLATARGYKSLDPNAVIEVQSQQIDRHEPSKRSYTVRGHSTAERYGARKPEPKAASTPKAPATPAPASYADVVNSMMKDHA